MFFLDIIFLPWPCFIIKNGFSKLWALNFVYEYIIYKIFCCLENPGTIKVLKSQKLWQGDLLDIQQCALCHLGSPLQRRFEWYMYIIRGTFSRKFSLRGGVYFIDVFPYGVIQLRVEYLNKLYFKFGEITLT